MTLDFTLIFFVFPPTFGWKAAAPEVGGRKSKDAEAEAELYECMKKVKKGAQKMQ